MPLITSLTHERCLAELLSDQIETNDSCRVLRSTDTEPGILEIARGLWFFYRVRGTYICEIYPATANFILDTITINNETMIQIPCDKRVICFGNQLWSNSCENQPAIISAMSWNSGQNSGVLVMPMTNVKHRLLSAFKKQSNRSHEELIKDLTNSRSFLRNCLNEIGYTILSIVLFLMSAVILYVLKCLRNKLQNDLDNLKEIVHHTLLH